MTFPQEVRVLARAIGMGVLLLPALFVVTGGPAELVNDPAKDSAPAGWYWPNEYEDDELGVINRQAIFDLDRGLQSDLDSLCILIESQLDGEIRTSAARLAEEGDSLDLRCAIQSRNLFVEAQRAWGTYCHAAARTVFYHYCGGSMARAAEAGFRIRLLRTRIEELENLYRANEND